RSFARAAGSPRSCCPDRCYPAARTRPRSSARPCWPRPAAGGWRRIAAELRRPPATLRRWQRAARGRHLDWLRHQGVLLAAELHPAVLVDVDAQPTELGDALAALAAAVAAWRLRFARHAEAWTLIGVFSRGRT